MALFYGDTGKNGSIVLDNLGWINLDNRKDTNHVVIGDPIVGKGGIYIGDKQETQGEIWLNDINIRELANTVEEQAKIIAQQTELINAMWYHPGMPGADEIEQKFQTNIEKLKTLNKECV